MKVNPTSVTSNSFRCVALSKKLNDDEADVISIPVCPTEVRVRASDAGRYADVVAEKLVLDALMSDIMLRRDVEDAKIPPCNHSVGVLVAYICCPK